MEVVLVGVRSMGGGECGGGWWRRMEIEGWRREEREGDDAGVDVGVELRGAGSFEALRGNQC